MRKVAEQAAEPVLCGPTEDVRARMNGLRDLYDWHNTHTFGDRLGPPHLEVRDLNDKTTTAGHAVTDNGYSDGDHTVLARDAVTKFEPEQVKHVLLHEMCHRFVWHSDQGHGPAWQAQMRRLAQQGVLNQAAVHQDLKNSSQTQIKGSH
jgi:hypothetical protein